MGGKGLVWMGMFVGSSVGSAVPLIWGGGLIAFTLWGGLGGILGIWAAYKLGQSF